MESITYKIPANCKTGQISTAKGIFKINEALSQADRAYLHKAGFFVFEIEGTVDEKKEAKVEQSKNGDAKTK